MAVVNTNSNLVHDTFLSGSIPADPELARGRLVLATGVVANAADDSTASMYHLVNVPSNAVIHEDTFFQVDGWGFAQVVIGTKGDTDALVDQTRATVDTVVPWTIGGASHGMRLWEVLGLAEDPGGNISLYAHAEANATGAGEMKFRVAYIMP